MNDEVWLVKAGGTVLNYVARTEDEANEHIGPDVAQGFRAVRYVLASARPEPTGDELTKALRRFEPVRCRQNPCAACDANEAAMATIRAAIAALPPSGALGLAREIEGLLAGPRTIQAANAHKKVIELVAMLERREA